MFARVLPVRCGMLLRLFSKPLDDGALLGLQMGAVRLSFLERHGRWRKLGKGSDSDGIEGSQGLPYNFLFR
jgi:hypothetical protein